MPKGLAFLNKKGFHPGRLENQKKKWLAEQRDKERKERSRNASKLIQESRERARVEDLFLKRRADEGGIGSEELATAIKQSSLRFMYERPPGLGVAQSSKSKEHDDDERKQEYDDGLTQLERAAGLKKRKWGTLEDQQRKFAFLQNAPVESAVKQRRSSVRLNPLGRVVRNVQCLRCGEYGHRSGERECKMRNSGKGKDGDKALQDPASYFSSSSLVRRRQGCELIMRGTGTWGGADEGSHPILLSEDEEYEYAYSSEKRRKRKKRKKKSSK